MNAASTAQQMLDPVRHGLPNGAWLVALLSLGVLAVCLPLLLRVMRGMGQPGPSMNADTAILAVPVALAGYLAPMLLFGPLVGGDPREHPMAFGAMQVAFTLAAMLALLFNPMQATATRHPWIELHPRWLPRMGGAYLLTFPMLQAASYLSVLLLVTLGITVQVQPVLETARASRDAASIAGWYVMAVLGAPLAEELVFRLAIFGGLVAFFSRDGRKLTRVHWLLAGAVSIAVFVLAHEPWNWPVGILPLTLLSVSLTALYAYTRSIWPGVIVHAVHNALVLTLQFFVVE